MPALPCQSIGLCRKMKELYTKSTEKMSFFSKRYTIFMIIILELISIFLANYYFKNYIFFWYPFLCNSTILLLLYKNYYDRKLLRYCKRTVLALKFLISYFLFNSFVLLTEFANNVYYQWITYLLLAASFIIILISIINYKPKS